MATQEEEDLLFEKLMEIQRKDRRYGRNAYLFLLDLVDFVRERLGIEDGERRHFSTQTMLSYVPEYARELLGPMAEVVFNNHFWGFRLTSDLGYALERLVEAQLLSVDEENDNFRDFDIGLTTTELLARRPYQVVVKV